MSLRESFYNAVTRGEYARTMAYLDEVQEVRELFEAAGNWQLDRAKQDLGWRKLAADATAAGLEREEKIAWARSAFRTEPFAKRGVLTKTNFCFGSGIDGPRGKQKTGEPIDPNVQALVDFWNDQGNQASMFSAPMQEKRSNQLLVDGDKFLLLFVRPNGNVTVRNYGTTLVKKIIPDPEDATRPLYYACKVGKYRFDKQQGGLVSGLAEAEWVYYRDFRNANPADDPLYGEVDADPDVYMMHIPINSISDSGFGESDLITSLSYLAATKQIAEDQGTISRATAALMNKLSAKTKSDKALTALHRGLKSTTESGGPKTPLPGAMNLLSEGAELNVNRASTNSGDAMQNSRMMRMAASVGIGLPLHYLGDPENANLATAKVMDTPALKMLEAYQSLWRSVYVDLFSFVLLQRSVDPQTVDYDIPLTAFQEPELGDTAAAIIEALDAGLITRTQAAQRTMELLGFDDIPARLEELLSEEAAKDAGDADALAQRLAAMDQAQPEPQEDADAPA